MNELAILAIKGNRYIEAENIYKSEVSSNPTSESYYGLGVCKTNLILEEQRTIDEVYYCFEKALEIADNKQKIELDIIAVVVNALQQIQTLYEQLEEEQEKQAGAALIGAALTVGAAAIGSSHKSNAFTQISSLAAAGAGVGISVGGLKKLGDISAIQSQLETTFANLKNGLLNIVIIEKSLVQSEFLLLKESLESKLDTRGFTKFSEKEIKSFKKYEIVESVFGLVYILIFILAATGTGEIFRQLSLFRGEDGTTGGVGVFIGIVISSSVTVLFWYLLKDKKSIFSELKDKDGYATWLEQEKKKKDSES
jgi:hypothetical protein